MALLTKPTRSVVATVLVMALVVGCEFLSTGKAYQEGIDGIIDEWFDVVRVAESTSRIVRRKAVNLTPPERCKSYHWRVGAAMNEQIEAYLGFMAQESDTEVSAHLQRAAAYWKAAGQYQDQCFR